MSASVLNQTKRGMIVEIAKTWPGHLGVDFEKATTCELLHLIQYAVNCDQKRLARGPECGG